MKARPSSARAPMIMPAMAPPLTEGDLSLLPVELELEAEEDDFVLVDDTIESVGNVTCEFEEVSGADVTWELEKELKIVAGVEVGVVESEVVGTAELELGAAVVEASGPAFAAYTIVTSLWPALNVAPGDEHPTPPPFVPAAV
jgi:hypothetical protein